MVEVASIGIFLVAAVASLFMAWTIGAGSSGSTPFAPAVGANAISVMQAGFIVGILGFLGAVLQGANVSEAIGEELIGGATLSPAAATIALLIAGSLVSIGIFTGYPIATAFTTTGAVIGIGLAMGGDPVWPKYLEIGSMWILTPFVGGGLAYAIARMLLERPRWENAVLVTLASAVGAVLANIEFAVLGSGNSGNSLAKTVGGAMPVSTTLGLFGVTVGLMVVWAGATALGVRSDAERTQRIFLLVMGGLVAFSAGGSQVGLAIGPLLPMMREIGVPLLALLFGGGIGLLAGSWTGAPRMIKAIAQDYSSLGPRRSIAALIPSFAIAQTAVLFGIPISFNEIIVSSIVGSGAAAGTGGSGVSAWKMGYTVLAWLLSLIGSLVLSYAIFYGASTVLL
ncbi:inorganic phosphate transporter [Natrinema sp. DC36]|uniref:inorganic phosphate transporter n=1 Tax=Natrinema sp. DC36 TaxID=2878680 RepID=UPI001CF07417|nr:inorganic phosphate transporter [Natrinema sp. DC36]